MKAMPLFSFVIYRYPSQKSNIGYEIASVRKKVSTSILKFSHAQIP